MVGEEGPEYLPESNPQGEGEEVSNAVVEGDMEGDAPVEEDLSEQALDDQTTSSYPAVNPTNERSDTTTKPKSKRPPKEVWILKK